jgi:hypothetical protein
MNGKNFQSDPKLPTQKQVIRLVEAAIEADRYIEGVEASEENTRVHSLLYGARWDITGPDSQKYLDGLRVATRAEAPAAADHDAGERNATAENAAQLAVKHNLNEALATPAQEVEQGPYSGRQRINVAVDGENWYELENARDVNIANAAYRAGQATKEREINEAAAAFAPFTVIAQMAIDGGGITVDDTLTRVTAATLTAALSEASLEGGGDE